MTSKCARYLLALIVGLGLSTSLYAVDWGSAASKDVTFFYPGRASWEKILTKGTHEGAKGVREKKPCLSCHEGEEAEMGELIATDPENPFYRKTDHAFNANATLQIAVADGAIHFRVSLPSTVPASQLTLMLDNGQYPHAQLSGCWSACHDDSRGMDSAGSSDLTKYLSASRTKNTRTGGGESYKSAEELAALMADGQYLELLGVDIATGEAFHGHILESRQQKTIDLVTANVSHEGDATVIELSRPLQSDHKAVKTIANGGSYTIGLSVHLNGQHGAEHLVTMATSFDIDQNRNITFLEGEE